MMTDVQRSLRRPPRRTGATPQESTMARKPHPKTEELARAFAAVLRADIGIRKLAAAVSANQYETSASVCHTHDWCDANESMAAAFESVFEREQALPCDVDEGLATQEQVDADIDVWNDAWNIAHANRFYLTDAEDPMRAAFVAAGWEECSTGGGCRAYTFTTPDRSRMYLATDPDGSSLPQYGQPVSIGEYDAKDPCDELREWTFTFDKQMLKEWADYENVGYTVESNDMSIFNPYESSCGRFDADPEAEYGLPPAVAGVLAALNDFPVRDPRAAMTEQQIEDLADEALNAAVLLIQNRLGMKDGDFAGMFFDGTIEHDVAGVLRDFIRCGISQLTRTGE
jgi:hypothetical protein